MRVKESDVVKVSVVNKNGTLLVPSMEEEGFSSIAGVISFARDKIPASVSKKGVVYRIYNKTREEYNSYNNSGNKVY